ncbi:MAG TPA: DNA polymerase III subunit delta [Candidatus Krumholzibacteria bacterium]|nr:DNA polymerase III subunit delta [Candidatus Krumholzibacteria bacterium]
MLRILDPPGLRAEFRQNSIAPAYLLAGPDGYRAEKTARWLRDKVVDAALGGLNSESVWGDETTPGKIAEAASAYPMFGGRRFLWVRHAEQLLSGAALDPLLRYLENPSDSTILVFTSQKLDKRLKLTSAFAKHGHVVEFARLSGRDLLDQVTRQARAHGLELAPEAVSTLVDLTGEDLAEIDQELAKLALQPDAAGGTLGAERVRELVGRSRDVDAFELADALDPAHPLQFVNGWTERRRRGGDVVGAAAILGWRIRQLAQLRAGLDSGMDAREAASAAGLAPFQQRRAIPLARNHSPAHLEKTLEVFRQADRRAKSSSLGPDLAFDLAVLRWATGPTS